MSQRQHEVRAFLLTGALNAVLDLALFNLGVLTVLSTHAGGAKLVSGLITTVIAWGANRTWVFKHRPKNRQRRHEAALFLAVNAVALGVTSVYVGLASMVADSHVWLNIHAICGIGVGTLVRAAAYHYVVFPKDQP